MRTLISSKIVALFAGTVLFAVPITQAISTAAADTSAAAITAGTDMTLQAWNDDMNRNADQV